MRKRKLYFGMRRRKPDRRPFPWSFEDYQRSLGVRQDRWPVCQSCNAVLQVDAMSLYRQHFSGKHRSNYSLDQVVEIPLPHTGVTMKLTVPGRERIWPREDLGMISESTVDSMPLPPGSLIYL